MKTSTAATRRTLSTLMRDAPHAADTLAPGPRLHSEDLALAVEGMPSRPLALDGCTYRVRHCWEVYDLMKRNLSPMPLTCKGKATRALRADRARWDKRRERVATPDPFTR